MGKLGRILDTFCLSSCSNPCFCVNSIEFEDEFESKPLIASGSDHKLRLKDVVAGKQTLGFQLKPKVRFSSLFQHWCFLATPLLYALLVPNLYYMWFSSSNNFLSILSLQFIHFCKLSMVQTRGPKICI